MDEYYEEALKVSLANFGLVLREGDFVRKDGSPSPLVIDIDNVDKLVLAASKAVVRRNLKPLL
jgi:hypothetical protein